jgi:tyrosine-protein phosphatase non-receptor type 1
MEEEYQNIHGCWSSYYTTICIEARNNDFTAVEALKTENKAYNRYRDVYPYDHSRVQLQSCSTTDYINASMVEVPEVGRKYILTQGPLENTTQHFWTMVWERESKAIIMLNRLIEKGSKKCHNYWPSSPGDILDCAEAGLVVINESVVPGQHYNLTTLSITNTEGERRTVLHFQYTTWPDFGVPTSPDTFLQFLGAVRESGSLENDVGPAIIHCSAGIGRSGSFILVDSCLLQAEEQGPQAVNIKQTLLNMRTFRLGLIQTEDQLKFSYLSILEGSRRAGLITGSVLLNDSTKDDIDISSSESEDDDIPPPLPPPRSESLQKKVEGVVEEECSIPTAADPFNQIPRSLPTVKNPGIDEDSSPDMSSPSTPVHKESPTKCLLNNNKFNERKREYELRRRKKEEEMAKTEEKIKQMKEKQRESEAWQSRKEHMRESLLPFCVGLAMFLAGGYYYFRG